MAAAHAAQFGVRGVFSGLLQINSLSIQRTARFCRPTLCYVSKIRVTPTASLSKTAADPKPSEDFSESGEESQLVKDAVPVDEALKHPDYFQVNKLFTIKDLFSAGVHYGHHKGCWNPLMKPYIYGRREYIHMIDLNQTVKHLQLALNVMAHIAYRGGRFLFVCMHPQFEYLTQKLARETDQLFVTRRWKGGTLTNTNQILRTNKHPDAIVFLSLPTLGRNLTALREASMCNIPIFAIVDTNCNPNLITYPIPGNDDSPTAMELYAKLFKQTLLEAKARRSILLESENSKR